MKEVLSQGDETQYVSSFPDTVQSYEYYVVVFTKGFGVVTAHSTTFLWMGYAFLPHHYQVWRTGL